MKKSLVLLAFGLALTAAPAGATGLLTCNSGDQSTWKTQEQLTAKITADGWKVRRIKIDGGCYEVYGTNPEGQSVEAYFDPKTMEHLLTARFGQILYKKPGL